MPDAPDSTPPDTEFDLSVHPHNGFVKRVFADIENARAFFQHYLPAPLVASIHWETLCPEPTTFVQANLQEVSADFTFSAKVGDTKTLFRILLEHQSRPQKRMALDLLFYMVHVWTHQTEDTLVPVLPFVLHQGPEGWSAKQQFADLFNLAAGVAPLLQPYLPDFRYELLDLSKAHPDKAEMAAQLKLALVLMKLAREKDLGGFLVWLVDWMRQGGIEVPERFLRLCFAYTFNVDTTLDAHTFASNLHQLDQLKEPAMTIAQQLRAEGRLEGERKGELKGAIKGQIRLMQDVLGDTERGAEALDTMSEEQLQELLATLNVRFRQALK
jgi:predicted transposase/invertase (TIGR01784 family)